MIILTIFDLVAGMPSLSSDIARASAWIGAVNDTLREWEIDTPLRAAMFLAHVAEETEELRELRENLNYSAQALVATWPSRFWIPDPSSHQSVEEQAALHPGRANAWDYHRQPQKIANHVYANRLGNGDEASGDGWNYRGGGSIMVTGKEEWRDASIAICGDADTLLIHPDLSESPSYAMPMGGWFWKTRNLNDFADRCDIHGSTVRINGGSIGAKERENYYKLFSARLKRYQ